MGNISCGYILWVTFYFWTIYLVGNITGCPQDIHMCTQDIKLLPTTYTHKIYTKYLVEYMWWVYHVDNTIYIVRHMFYVVGTHLYLVGISCGHTVYHVSISCVYVYILWVYVVRTLYMLWIYLVCTLYMLYIYLVGVSPTV